MKMIKTPLFAFLLLCFSTALKAQYIQVNDNFTAQQLVENVLINSSCAEVSNFSVVGYNFDDGRKSYGRFSGTGSTFPFQDGIILSTGKAISARGPNSNILSEGPMSWGGDGDLESALSIGNSSVNATVLEFDFLPVGDKISFDYIFSSEQYLSSPSSNQCNYTDGFVFLLKEANTTNPYQNLAVVPGTNIPIKSNTVRGPGTICPPANAQYFDAFNEYQHPTNFNGQTKVLTAQSAVTPGTLYHIKLVVADQGNNLYDSAIFLGAGSFKIEKDLGPDRLSATANPLCPTETLQLDATTTNATGYAWYKDNVLQPETTPTFTVTEQGVYSVEISLGGTCASQGEISVEYAQSPGESSAELVQCDEDNDGSAIFNLDQATGILTGNDDDFTATYFLTVAAAEDGSAPITNTSSFENTQSIVYARVENRFGCYTVSEVTLYLSNNTIANPDDLQKCDTDANPSDGFSTFDLTETEAEILANLPGGNVSYYLSNEDALLSLNPITTPEDFQNTVAFQQTIFAKLSSGVDCYGIASFDIIVNSFQGSFDDVERDICSGNSIQLNAGSGFSSYSWNTNPVQTSQIITISNPGTYIVTVSNAFGCTTTKKFIVSASSIAQVSSVSVNDFQGGLNSATINLTSTSIGDYEYSLDGAVYQNSPTFIGLNPGQYTVYINDKNECGQISYDFYVMDYPKFFTPNQDGVNDIWRIPFLQFQPKATVAIYDRYGKLLHFFTGSQPGWDGTFKGKNVFANDYWFVITLENGREVKGHFSLVR